MHKPIEMWKHLKVRLIDGRASSKARAFLSF